MLNCYDKALKNHVESFLKVGKRKIKVYGLQNEDSEEDLGFTQAGLKTDSLTFPMVMLIRLPEIEITDNAMTKRPANYEGYLAIDDSSKVSLNVMRCSLHYVLDVVAENRKTTEDIGTQLYFRLRNHPNFSVSISLPVKDSEGNILTTECTPNLVLSNSLTHVRSNNNELAQLYRLRISFDLENVNIFDFENQTSYDIDYKILASLKELVNFKEI